jgi:hypothetical protein
MGFRQRISEAYNTTKDYVRDLAVRTKVEIVAGALAGAIALGTLGHVNETRRSLFQPISYSEYEQIEDRARAQNQISEYGQIGDSARAQGRRMNELTWFYVGVNDFSAKIMEAYNWNSIWGIIPEFHRDWFSKKLEQEMDTTGKTYRRNIRDFARIIPEHGRGALRELSDLTSASQESNNLRELFGQTWNYGHTESGHWEYHEVCTTDSDNHESCTTESEYVCDSYHHTWTYHPTEGIRSSRALVTAKQRVPEIQRLQIETAKHTKAWNEQVIKQSFRHMDDREPTDAEMLQASQHYKTGSQYEINIDPARNLWNSFINQDIRTWQSYLSTAQTTHRTTGCHSTEGPREYEFAQDIQRRLSQFIQHEQNITTGIQHAISNVPSLEQKIKVFFVRQNPQMRGHFPELRDNEIMGSSSRLSRQVISGARTLYRENIPNGNPDTSYRFWLTLLYAIGGSILGGLAGLGADALVDKYIAPKFNRYRSDY